MTTRRRFLQTAALAVLSPREMARAQDTPKPTSSDIVFADFESGTYDGWTLTGNCWTPQPYSDSFFPGKITGYQGKRFLCTFHPVRGNSATGKATSNEFTIEKPFINFLIGGGNHPGETCINLVVDGTVVRSATGNDSADFSRCCWDVYELTGKKARLVVIDYTISAQLGYILVDDIRFSIRPDTPQQIVVEKIIRRAIGLKPVPGIVAGISLNGKIVACVASGMRKRGDTTPILLTDPVMIGSVTKVLAGAVIAKCVQDGKISWKDTFEECVPDIAKQTQNPVTHATLQQFMTHTSGLPYYEGKDNLHRDTSPYPDNSALRREAVRYHLLVPPVGPPGDQRQYAAGPTFASVMTENRAGRSFDSLMEQVLVKEFGMRQLLFGDQGSDEGIPSCPRGHQFNKDGSFLHFGNLNEGPMYSNRWWKSSLVGGGAISCLDMLQFAEKIANRSVPGYPEYDNQFFDDLYTRRVSNSINTNGGWEDGVNDVGERTISHTGNTGRGEWAMLSAYPKGREAIFVYANMNYPTNDFHMAMETYVPMSNWVRRGVLGY